jgi:hypothetical protein
MLNTIVWATDGSENAARALSSARALLPEGAMLIAVHIVPESAGHHADGAGGTHPDPPDVVASLRKLVAEVSEDGVNVALRIADYIGPQPAKGIADIAREVGADVIDRRNSGPLADRRGIGRKRHSKSASDRPVPGARRPAPTGTDS